MPEAEAKAEVLSHGFEYEVYHVNYPNRSKPGLLSTGAEDLVFVNSDGESPTEGDGRILYIIKGIGKFIFYYNVTSVAEADVDVSEVRNLPGKTEQEAVTLITNLGLTYEITYFNIDSSSAYAGLVNNVSFDESKEYLPRGSVVKVEVFRGVSPTEPPLLEEIPSSEDSSSDETGTVP